MFTVQVVYSRSNSAAGFYDIEIFRNSSLIGYMFDVAVKVLLGGYDTLYLSFFTSYPYRDEEMQKDSHKRQKE